MKVKDLKAFLETCNPESRVVTFQANGEVNDWCVESVFIQIDPTYDEDDDCIPDVEIVSFVRP